MYAIISAGGKHFRAEEGSVIRVEKLNVEEGTKVKFDVLFINKDGSIKMGDPVVKGAYAEAEVVKNGKGAKIDIFKYKSKKNERKRQGHRQPYSEVKIVKIKG